MVPYRVVNLDGLSGIKSVNIIRPCGSLPHRVLGQAEDGVQVLFEALTNGSVKRAKNAVEKIDKSLVYFLT